MAASDASSSALQDHRLQGEKGRERIIRKVIMSMHQSFKMQCILVHSRM